MTLDTLKAIALGMKTEVEYLIDARCSGMQTPSSMKGRILKGLYEEMDRCRSCRLGALRRRVVPGSGNPDADIMLIGEAPGEEEDLQGIPFVGRAGQELTSLMMRILGISREEVYIANILKCRPPGNRDPAAEEISACLAFLMNQICVVNPIIIVLLGAVATRNLLKTEKNISRIRGDFIYQGGRIWLPTFHPSFLLRNPAKIALAEADFKKLKDKCNELK